MIPPSRLFLLSGWGDIDPPLRASNDHRFIVGAPRAQKPYQLPRHPAPRLGYTPPMPPPSDLSFVDSLTSEQRQIFYERHRFLAILMILVVLLFPFAGLYVTGLFGAVLGLLLSLAAFYLTPYVWLTLARHLTG